MKSFISLIIFLKCFFLFNAVIPVWDLTKVGQELKPPYSYVEYEGNYDDYYHIKFTRTINWNNNILNYTNYVEAYDTRNPSDKKTAYVDFEHINGFYYLNNIYYICPKGKYHLYDLTNKKHIKPNDFEEKGDYELKCSFHSNSQVFIAFYLMNGESAMYSVYIFDKIDNMKKKGKLGEELYDYRLVDEYKENYEYYLLALDKLSSYLQLNTFKATLKSDYQGVNSIQNRGIVKHKTNLQACFRNISSKYPYDFYYITYNDLSDLESGYSISAPTSWEDFKDVTFKNNEIAHFEFLEDSDILIEEIKFMYYNRYAYYKLKINGTNNTSYYGIFDTKLNKVIFNTNQYIRYYLPFSETAMLAITESSAYKICAINGANGCTDYCENDEYYLDTEGNKCGKPSCPSDKIMLMPSGVCNKTCDSTYFVEVNGTCGLCKYFNLENGYIYKLVGGTECLNQTTNRMSAFNSKLGLYECNSEFVVKNNTCDYENHCPDNCTKCDGKSCTECGDGFLLEDGVCKEHCSQGKGFDGEGCKSCERNGSTNCDTYLLDTCNCTKCKDSYFLEDINCTSCDKNCKNCEGKSTNCTECDNNYFLENNYCYSCNNENCSEKENDNCRCKTCKKGFYLNSTYSCESCIANCDSCQNSTSCDQCSPDFYKNEKGSCIPCPTNCATKKQNSCLCETCNEFSFMNNDKECENCLSPCKSCDINATNCTTCIDGFFMNETENCEKCDETKCETCSSNKDHCDSCKAGKYLIKENNTCQNCDEHCETCFDGPSNGSHNCLSCKSDSKYKYLKKDENKFTCVESCSGEGWQLKENSFECVPSNSTQNDPENKKNSGSDYLLWIFVAVVAVLLIIITFCICKKCLGEKNNNEIMEEITTELDDKEIFN